MSADADPFPKKDLSLWNALPFWCSLALVPIAFYGASTGGWALALMPLSTWYFFGVVDRILGKEEGNADLDASPGQLTWYKAITLIWAPVQFLTIFGVLWIVTGSETLALWEKVLGFVGVGVLTGTIGINYAHELMHQKSRLERNLADILLAMVLYSHFRSEHLLVHHRYVGTPRDLVTARYNEGFYRFFGRVLRHGLGSAASAERAMLERKGKPVTDVSNPFWLYAILQGGFLALAALIGGFEGVVLFGVQAFIAIWQLELVNYVEHYGLTRRHLGEGKYEHTQPHHSWNAPYKATNWMLINLQRHSDHHFKPNRPFPLLQTYETETAPQLPRSYAVMTIAAMIPPAWRRIMNPRVRAWRKHHYPDIADWTPYKMGTNPLPR